MTKLILHVDDDPQLPEGVSQTLTTEGYRWLHTTDPESVMRLIESGKPDLLLLDIDLAGCDGLDLLAGIRSAHGGGLPILVSSGLPRNSGPHGEAIALGVIDFLTKPVLASQLLTSIREAAPIEGGVADARTAPVASMCGQIGDTPVPELFARLRRRGTSGVLKLHKGGRWIEVEFRLGTPVCVNLNRRASESAAPGQNLAEAAVFASFGWTDGIWQIDTGRRLAPESVSQLSCDPAELILRGVMRKAPVELARERLRKRAALYVSRSRNCGDPIGGVRLPARQLAILEELTGHDSLGSLLASNAFEERMLYGLWLAGRIEFHVVPTLDLSDLYDHGSALPDALETGAERREVRKKRLVPSRPVMAPGRNDGKSADVSQDPAETLRTLRDLARELLTGDDFGVLAVDVDVSPSRLRDAYRRSLERIPAGALESKDLGLRTRAERIRDRIEAAYAHLSDAESRRAYALLRREEDEDLEARKAAARVIEAQHWFQKGEKHLEVRRHAEAAEAFGMASHLSPGEGRNHAHLGYALFLSNPHDEIVRREAMEHVATGIKFSPNDPLAHVYLGRILLCLGDRRAALRLFRRALRIDPNCHGALQEVRLLEMRNRKAVRTGNRFLSRLLRS